MPQNSKDSFEQPKESKKGYGIWKLEIKKQIFLGQAHLNR
jgi:hypothetical protein